MDASFAMDTTIVLFAAAVLVVACSGTAATSLPSTAPQVDVVAPPPGVADRGDDPAVVAIDAGDATLCAGALVAPDVVLTARHCVSAPARASGCTSAAAAGAPPLRAPGSLRILLGDDMTTATERARGRAIRVPSTSSMCGADIALLLLDVPIDDVQPLVVRPTGAAQGDHLRTIGWRLPEGAGRAPKILRDHLLVLGATPTELELAEAITGLGGPALDEATAEVLGVFSRSDAAPSRAVYTRADAFAAADRERPGRERERSREHARLEEQEGSRRPGGQLRGGRRLRRGGLRVGTRRARRAGAVLLADLRVARPLPCGLPVPAEPGGSRGLREDVSEPQRPARDGQGRALAKALSP